MVIHMFYLWHKVILNVLSITMRVHMAFTLFLKDFVVREYAISLAGRLSEKNPAYVLPALRRHLIQLLTYLEQRYCINFYP